MYTPVRDLMRRRILVLSPELTLLEAGWFLIQNGVSSAPVVDPEGTVVGLLSRTDLVRYGCAGIEGMREVQTVTQEVQIGAYHTALRRTVADRELAGPTVTEAMSPFSFNADPAADISVVIEQMLEGQIHEVMVVRDGRLLGYVTMTDVVRYFGTLRRSAAAAAGDEPPRPIS